MTEEKMEVFLYNKTRKRVEYNQANMEERNAAYQKTTLVKWNIRKRKNVYESRKV